MFLAACTKVIQFTGEDSEPLLVVNGIQQVGKTPNLMVSKSRFFLESEGCVYARGVAAKLFVDDVFVEDLSVRDTVFQYYSNEGSAEMCYCTGNYVFQEGDRVRFVVSSDDFDEPVTADVVMPAKPEVSYFDTLRVIVAQVWPSYEEAPNYYTSVDANGNPCWIFEWNDHHPETGELILHTDTIYPGDPERLEITASLGINDPEGAQYYNLEPVEGIEWFKSSDPVFSDFALGDVFDGNSVYGSRLKFNVFSDNTFQGALYDLKFFWENDFPFMRQKYAFSLSLVDEHCFRYIQSYRKYEENSWMEDIGNLFSEPTQVYSNVKGGIGIVGAQGTPVVVEMVLDNFK